MARVCVVHLASGSLGPQTTAEFARTLRAHDAGVDHDLLVVFNGVPGRAVPTEFAEALDGIEHASVFIEDWVIDLEAYRQGIAAATGEIVCCVNSGARVLADAWLARLADAAPAGLAGATGSWESAFSSAPLTYRLRRLGFARFPNPHIRTNAFAARRDVLAALDWPQFDSKLAALRFESGRHGLTRQVTDNGLQAVVVGRDGRSYEPVEWPRSATFRCGGQRNLLVGDNRTQQYADASPDERLRLARMAWGDAAAGD